MKMKKTNVFIAALAAFSVVGAAQASGSKNETYSQALAKVPAIEIPAQVTKAVMDTDVDKRVSVAVGLVRLVAIQNETALVPTVAALASAQPELAPEVAAAAAKAAPKLAEQIAMRMSQAAPKLAAQIAAAVAKEVPAKAVQVATEVRKGTRGADAMIVAAVGRVVPASLPTLQQRLPSEILAESLAGGGELTQTPVAGTEPTAAPNPSQGYDQQRDYAN